MLFDTLETVRHWSASARAPLTREVVDSLEDLAALQGEWRWLCARCPDTSPALRPERLLSWFRHVAPTPRPWVLTLRSEGRLVGLAPLTVRVENGARTVRLLGEGMPACLDILMDRELAPHGGVLLLEWLTWHRERWDTCVFEQLREGSRLLSTPLPAGWSERREARAQPEDGLGTQRHYRRSLWLTPAVSQ